MDAQTWRRSFFLLGSHSLEILLRAGSMKFDQGRTEVSSHPRGRIYYASAKVAKREISRPKKETPEALCFVRWFVVKR